jgi:hypothetical protein
MTPSEPPPYEPIDDDDDKLPAYSNSIHLVTLCRRKLEYTAPNVPARKGTRGWNFYWLVLCGTALTVYQPNRSEVNAHLKREAVIRAARLKEHKRATATPARKISDLSAQSTASRLRTSSTHTQTNLRQPPALPLPPPQRVTRPHLRHRRCKSAPFDPRKAPLVHRSLLLRSRRSRPSSVANHIAATWPTPTCAHTSWSSSTP